MKIQNFSEFYQTILILSIESKDFQKLVFNFTFHGVIHSEKRHEETEIPNIALLRPDPHLIRQYYETLPWKKLLGYVTNL